MKNLIAKIVKIREELPGILKDNHVKFGTTNYMALSETAVLKQIKPLFDKYKLALIPEAVTHLELKDKITAIAVRYNLIDADSGEVISVSSVGNGHDSADKGAGKAFTYCTKHAYLKMLMLISGEDPDDISSEEIVHRESQKKADPESEPENFNIAKSKIRLLKADGLITEKEAETITNQISAVKDNPDRLKKAIGYLENLRKDKE